MSEKLFYTVRETAAVLCLAEISIYRGTKSGKIPSRKIGGRVLVPRAWLDEMAAIPEPALEQ